jgi:uncharacterized protein
VLAPVDFALYVLLGAAIGTLGTLIGAGGGFVLVPVLALLEPSTPPEAITAISLSVVCVNAMSGSLAYRRMGRIDDRSALLFAAAGFPGSILGAWTTHLIDRKLFDPLLGGLLLVGATLVVLRPTKPDVAAEQNPTRRITDRDGKVYAYSPRIALGLVISVGVGFLSGLLGIGGGIIHVPAMVLVLNFPAHIATATSHLVLAMLSGSGVAVHLFSGTLAHAAPRIVPLAIGVVGGAQLGARLSSKLHGKWILTALALALASVGVRLLVH